MLLKITEIWKTTVLSDQGKEGVYIKAKGLSI